MFQLHVCLRQFQAFEFWEKMPAWCPPPRNNKRLTFCMKQSEKHGGKYMKQSEERTCWFRLSQQQAHRKAEAAKKALNTWPVWPEPAVSWKKWLKLDRIELAESIPIQPGATTRRRIGKKLKELYSCQSPWRPCHLWEESIFRSWDHSTYSHFQAALGGICDSEGRLLASSPAAQGPFKDITKRWPLRGFAKRLHQTVLVSFVNLGVREVTSQSILTSKVLGPLMKSEKFNNEIQLVIKASHEAYQGQVRSCSSSVWVSRACIWSHDVRLLYEMINEWYTYVAVGCSYVWLVAQVKSLPIQRQSELWSWNSALRAWHCALAHCCSTPAAFSASILFRAFCVLVMNRRLGFMLFWTFAEFCSSSHSQGFADWSWFSIWFDFWNPLQ